MNCISTIKNYYYDITDQFSGLCVQIDATFYIILTL